VRARKYAALLIMVLGVGALAMVVYGWYVLVPLTITGASAVHFAIPIFPFKSMPNGKPQFDSPRTMDRPGVLFLPLVPGFSCLKPGRGGGPLAPLVLPSCWSYMGRASP